MAEQQEYDITPEDYADGTDVYIFNMAADDSGSSAFQLVKTGDVSVEIKLSAATAEAVCLIVLYEYDSFVEIDADRNVHYGHSGTKSSAE